MKRQTRIRYRVKSPQASGEGSAPRRGFIPSSAAQLPRHCGGTCRHCRAAPAAEHRRRCNPSEVCAANPTVAVVVAVQMSGRQPRRSSPCPHPLSAERTSVQPLERTSGVQGTGVHATRVIRVSGQTGVWCPQPRCPHRAGFRTSVRWDGPRLAQRVRRVGAVVGERLSRRTRIGPGGEGMVERWPWVAGTSVDGRPGPPRGMRTGCGATLAAWPTRGAGPAQVPVDWLGSREGAVTPTSPACASWAGCWRDGRPWGWTRRW
jgi:hypothetical protein